MNTKPIYFIQYWNPYTGEQEDITDIPSLTEARRLARLLAKDQYESVTINMYAIEYN